MGKPLDDDDTLFDGDTLFDEDDALFPRSTPMEGLDSFLQEVLDDDDGMAASTISRDDFISPSEGCENSTAHTTSSSSSSNTDGDGGGELFLFPPPPYDSKRDILFPSNGKSFDKNLPAHQRFLQAIEERRTTYQQRPNKNAEEGKQIKTQLINEVIAAPGPEARFFVQVGDSSLWDKEEISTAKLQTRIDSRLRTNKGKKKTGSTAALEEVKDQEEEGSPCPVWKYRFLHSPEDLIAFECEVMNERIEAAYQNLYHLAPNMMQQCPPPVPVAIQHQERQANYEIKVVDGTLWERLPSSDNNGSMSQGKAHRVLVGSLYRCPPCLARRPETSEPAPIACPAAEGARKMAPQQEGPASSSSRTSRRSNDEAENANRKRKSSSQAPNDDGAAPQDSIFLPISLYRLATSQECFTFVEELFEVNDNIDDESARMKPNKALSIQQEEEARKKTASADSSHESSPSASRIKRGAPSQTRASQDTSLPVTGIHRNEPMSYCKHEGCAKSAGRGSNLCTAYGDGRRCTLQGREKHGEGKKCSLASCVHATVGKFDAKKKPERSTDATRTD